MKQPFIFVHCACAFMDERVLKSAGTIPAIPAIPTILPFFFFRCVDIRNTVFRISRIIVPWIFRLWLDWLVTHLLNNRRIINFIESNNYCVPRYFPLVSLILFSSVIGQSQSAVYFLQSLSNLRCLVLLQYKYAISQRRTFHQLIPEYYNDTKICIKFLLIYFSCDRSGENYTIDLELLLLITFVNRYCYVNFRINFWDICPSNNLWFL